MKLRLTALAAFAAGGVVLTGTAQGLGGLPVGTQGEHSDNVHALFNFPTGSGVGGRFDGSYYFQTTSTPVDMAGVGPASLGGGLAVFDVHNPEKPKIAGYLPLPEWENEDVSISHSRHLLTISIDNRKMLPNVTSSPRIPGRLYVIDISTPTAPKILSTTDYPASVGTNPETGAPLGGAGHTATFVGKDRYVMVSGARDGSTLVLDTFNASAPKVLGSFKSPAGVGNAVFKTGIVHDIYEDTYKNVWLTGSGGTAMYAPLTDPLHMKLLAAALPKDNTRLNQYITHNAMRIDKQTVMVTEESYDAGDCGNDADTGLQDGSVQLWHIDLAHKVLRPITFWDAPHGAADTGVSHDVLGFCSSHWFTMNSHKIVADAWYSAGVRFLDISDPKHIRPVGFYAGDANVASQAVFFPGRDDIVYVADYIRGLDVVKLDKGGVGAVTVNAPLVPSRSGSLLKPSSELGWICAQLDTAPGRSGSAFGLGFTASAGS